MIIMVSGYKRSGKDTCANYITKNYNFTRYAFADPIKKIVSEIYGWSLRYIEEHKEEIDVRYGISPRQALQDFGTNYMQLHMCKNYPNFEQTIGRNFWVKKFKYLYMENPKINYVISDYRFPFEYEELKEYHPVTLRIINDKCVCDGHESESYVKDLYTCFDIDNNSTIDAFYKNIKESLNLGLQGIKEM